MLSLLTALALAAPAQADCGARLLRVADDQPWLQRDVRAVLRTVGAPDGVARWLVDLGDAGCGPGGACAPVIEASPQPDRTTAFFAGRVPGPAVGAGDRLTARVTLDDGRTLGVPLRARTGGHANLHTVAVDGADLLLTRPVVQHGPGGARVVVRAVGLDAPRVQAVTLAPAGGDPLSLERRQLHRVAEGEARADLGRTPRTGPATVQGLDAAGVERCFESIDAELDLGWQPAAR